VDAGAPLSDIEQAISLVRRFTIQPALLMYVGCKSHEREGLISRFGYASEKRVVGEQSVKSLATLSLPLSLAAFSIRWRRCHSSGKWHWIWSGIILLCAWSLCLSRGRSAWVRHDWCQHRPHLYGRSAIRRRKIIRSWPWRFKVWHGEFLELKYVCLSVW